MANYFNFDRDSALLSDTVVRHPRRDAVLLEAELRVRRYVERYLEPKVYEQDADLVEHETFLLAMRMTIAKMANKIAHSFGRDPAVKTFSAGGGSKDLTGADMQMFVLLEPFDSTEKYGGW